MAYVIEDMTQFDLSDEEASKLCALGMLVRAEGETEQYETAALLWDDLELTADQTFTLLETLLGRSSSPPMREVAGPRT